jgi:hypothetical protein
MLQPNCTHMPTHTSLHTNDNIIHLLDDDYDVNIPAEHFNSSWRQMYAEHIRHHQNIIAPYAHPDHIWKLIEEQMLNAVNDDNILRINEFSKFPHYRSYLTRVLN